MIERKWESSVKDQKEKKVVAKMNNLFMVRFANDVVVDVNHPNMSMNLYYLRS